MGDNKADAVKRVMAAAKEADVPSMIWQISRPGKKADDFEVRLCCLPFLSEEG